MCELMGLSFARPIRADFSIREFALRSTENADGWGLAWYPDRSLALIKEPIKWQASGITRFLESYPGLVAPLYLAHVRHKTTGGDATHADTHPFARELAGRDYCFAHNGTLSGDFWNLSLGRFHPVGATDSEFLFCLILGQLESRGHTLNGPDGWRWLGEQLVAMNRYGKLNAILADGRRLFCYHDAAGFKELHFRAVHIQANEIRRFQDLDLRVDLAAREGSSPAAPSDPTDNHGFVIATHPLSSTGWHSFQAGELLVFEGGVLQFSNQRDLPILVERLP
jgi:predicted glutamine amidotransferase